METRNELGFLISSRYYSSDFVVPREKTHQTPQLPILPSESPTATSRALPIPSPLLTKAMGTTQSSPRQLERPRNNGPNLLTVPLEIRLHIYHYVLLSHPIHHAHLAPLKSGPDLSGLNTEEFHTTMIRSHGTSSIPREIVIQLVANPSPSSSSKPTDSESYISTPLPPTYQTSKCHRRIQGKIPTSLLTSCKQIYAETSHLPWTTNTFGFINWFCSGVYAAQSFTGRLPEWQRKLVTNVEVEVLGKDLWVAGGEMENGRGNEQGTEKEGGEMRRKEGKGIREWKDLCALWGGVQNLKMVIKGSLIFNTPVTNSNAISPYTTTTSSPGRNPTHKRNPNPSKQTILNTSSPWITHGLLALPSLRSLELEIEDSDVDSETKKAFCAELEGVLNSSERRSEREMSGGMWRGDVRVIFVERVKVLLEGKGGERKGGFVYYGGEPGDEGVWSQGM